MESYSSSSKFRDSLTSTTSTVFLDHLQMKLLEIILEPHSRKTIQENYASFFDSLKTSETQNDQSMHAY